MKTGTTKSKIISVWLILAIVFAAVIGAVVAINTVDNGAVGSLYSDKGIDNTVIADTVEKLPITISKVRLSNVTDGKIVYNGTNEIVAKEVEFTQKPADDADVWMKITATTVDKNVGDNLELTYKVELFGTDADKYTATVTDTQKVSRIAKSVTLKKVVATNRAYNATTDIALSGGELEGMIEGDQLSFSIVDNKGTVTDANVGNRKEVAYVAELAGADSTNYTLTNARVLVNITKVALTAEWSGLQKEYDGTQCLPTITLKGVLDGENVLANAVYNDKEKDGINVVLGGGYTVGLQLSGNDKDNYTVTQGASEQVIITPRVAQVAWVADSIKDNYVANVDAVNILAVVTNAIEGDTVNVIVINGAEKAPGYHIAQVARLDNDNYVLPEQTITQAYTVKSGVLMNNAVTAMKLNLSAYIASGFEPTTQFYVEKIEETAANAGELTKEEKQYAAYRVRFADKNNQTVAIEGTVKYVLSIPKDSKSVQTVKIAIYDGQKVEILNLDIVNDSVVFEAANVQEINVIMVYVPVFQWLWIALAILGVILAIVAIWLIIYACSNRKMLFDPSGGEPIEGIRAKWNQEIELPKAQRDSHTFNGWFTTKKYKNGVKNKMPFWDNVVIAKWLDKDGVPVPYCAGSAVLAAAREAAKPVEIGNEIAEQDSNVVRTITMATRGGVEINPIKAIKLSPVVLPMPIKQGDAFAGWYYDEKMTKEAVIEVMPKKDVTIYAKWASDRVIEEKTTAIKVDKSDKTRTLTFETRGGSNIDSIVAVKKSKINFEEPTKANDTFAYWSTDEKNIKKKIKLNVMPQEDMTAYAVWASDLNPVGQALSEESKRNQIVNEMSQEKEKAVFEPEEFQRMAGVPTAVDDKIDALMFGRDKMPSGRLVDSVQKQNVAAPMPVERERQPQPKPQESMPKNDKVIVEKVEPVETKMSLQDKLLTKVLMFNVRGGDSIKPMQAKIGVQLDLPTPVKGESKFLGWYKDEGLTKKCDFTKMPSKNTMLFAKWIEDGTVQELYDSGLTSHDNDLFNENQSIIENMLKSDEQGLDNIAIQRTATKKSSMLSDDRKKKK